MLKTRTNKLQAVRLNRTTRNKPKKRKTLRSGLEMPLRLKLLRTTKLKKVKRKLMMLLSLRNKS